MMGKIRYLLGSISVKFSQPGSFTNYIWLLPLCLLLLNFWLDPFKDILASNKASLTTLNALQRSNIELAAAAIDGAVIAPGAVFSFNKTVGPRTFQQGYLQSPSYVNSETPMTFGGGICLLSSLLYKNALELGLTVKERTAHSRTTQCVPPGFDATVWYGQNDLKLINTLGIPLRLQTQVNGQTLTVNILGASSSSFKLRGQNLRRIVTQTNKNAIEVCVLRSEGSRSVLISRDRYWLAGSSNSMSHVKHQVN